MNAAGDDVTSATVEDDRSKSLKWYNWRFYPALIVSFGSVWKTWEYSPRDLSVDIYSSLRSYATAGLIAAAGSIKALLSACFAQIASLVASAVPVVKMVFAKVVAGIAVTAEMAKDWVM